MVLEVCEVDYEFVVEDFLIDVGVLVFGFFGIDVRIWVVLGFGVEVVDDGWGFEVGVVGGVEFGV